MHLPGFIDPPPIGGLEIHAVAFLELIHVPQDAHRFDGDRPIPSYPSPGAGELS